jgi:hypothetical protein
VLSGSIDVAHILTLDSSVLLFRPFQNEIRETDDGVQGRPQLVAHVGKELALGAIGGFGSQHGQASRLRVPLRLQAGAQKGHLGMPTPYERAKLQAVLLEQRL